MVNGQQMLVISTDGYDEVLQGFAATEKQIQRASARSVKKVTRWAGSQIARGISVEDAVPLKALTAGAGRTGRMHRRVRVYPPKNGMIGQIWVGHNPVKAAYLGRIVQQPRKGGARAGKHFFEGSFVATMRSGHHSVFYRDGGVMKSDPSRESITEEEISLNSSRRVVARVSDQVPQRLADILKREMNYEANVRDR